MRRLLAAAGAAVAVLLTTATPAGAHEFSAAELGSPGEGTVYDGPPVLSGQFQHDDSGIDRVDLALVLTDRSGPGEPPGEDACTPPYLSAVDGGGEATVTFDLPLPELACNGVYTVTAEARSEPHTLSGEVTSTSISRTFSVASPPARPAGLDVLYDDGDRTVTLLWDPNDEVDLLGYLVERSVAGAPFEVIADVTGTRYVDEAVADGGGEHVYQIVAVRRGPSDDAEAVASAPSRDAAADVPAAPEPTTTTTSGSTSTTSAGPAASGSGSGTAPRGSVDLSGYGALQERARRPVQRSPRVTIDTGFAPTLPFQVPPPTEPEPSTTTTTEQPTYPEDAAIIRFEEEEPDVRAVMIPAAGALTLIVGSLQMRYLLRRASASPG